MRRANATTGLGLVLIALFAGADTAHAGAFTFITESNPRKIAHPEGYVPGTPSFNVTICVDPTSVNASAMEISMQNIANTYSQRLVTSPNLGVANVPLSEYDFESVAMHELGHCLGLGHTNIGTDGPGAADDYAKSFDGADDTFDLDDGADNVIGSADDLRDEDVNALWFFKATNNPFLALPGTIDSSTYSRLLADLPGDTFATSASNAVGVALGVSDTEAVMQQGTSTGQAQRRLSADDVATLRFAMSGLDETQGNSDDYSFTVSYSGLTTGCDVIFDFDAAETGFAKCSVIGNVFGDHRIITSANAWFHPTAGTWFFNDQLDVPPAVPVLPRAVGVLLTLLLALLAAVSLRRRA